MSRFKLHLHFYNGARELLDNTRITVSVINGQNQLLGTTFTECESLDLDLNLTGSPITDRFTLNASAKGFRDSGFIGLRPPQPQKDSEAERCLMLVERDARPHFLKPENWPAGWEALRSQIGEKFTDFAEATNLGAACLLNLLEAIRLFPGNLLETMNEIPLSPATGQTRDQRKTGILQDRALLFVDPKMLSVIKGLSDKDRKQENASAHGALKPGESRISFKEIRFPEANLQFTLFTNKEGKLYADIDMDYFNDKLSHGFLELFPNTLLGTRTDPRKIYALRWMAGKNAKAPDNFSPPYFLTQ